MKTIRQEDTLWDRGSEASYSFRQQGYSVARGGEAAVREIGLDTRYTAKSDEHMVGVESQEQLLGRLSGIVSAKKLDASEKIVKLMELVRDQLGVSSSTLCAIDQEVCRVVNFVAPPGNAPRDPRFPLHGSFVERIISAPEDVQVLSSINYPAPYHPLYSHAHPAVVVGCKLFSHSGSRDGELLGVLDFSSAFKKDGQLSKVEIALINLVASFITEMLYSTKLVLVLKEEREHLQAELATRKKGEEKFRQIENLVRTVAHEYNNILVAIMGSCDLAMMDLPEDSEVQRRLVLIQRSAQRAADLTEKLISSSGDTEPDLSPIGFSNLVRSVVSEVKEHLQSGTRLEFQDASNLPQVNADSEQLRKAFLGVINNSLESLDPRGGLVSVFTGVVRVDQEYLNQCHGGHSFSVGDYVYVKISDTGGGINREFLSRVFEPNFSTKVGGKGINLSEVLEIVVAHGGAVDFSSTVSVGTTVKMLFPILRREEEREAGPVTKGDVLDDKIGATVLIVDDEESVCLIAEEILRKTGYRTLQARNGVEAIETFRTYADDISVAILDLTMPDMTGLEVYERFRGIRPDIPVIIASGYHKGAVISEFAGKPYLDFVHKPFAPHELVDRVKFSMRKKSR